ncbi:MAG: sialidase family protein, partial [Egibacteraceae bacterium]
DGTLYVAYVNLMGRGNVPDNLWLARSEDGGATLSEPVRVAGERVFQTRVVVDPDGVVHLTYMQADDIGVWALASPPTLVATRSEDGGETFSDPVPFSDPARPRVAAATPVIDADGDLVVLYQDFKDNVRDFQNLEGPAWEGTSALVLTRSTDGGRTFSPGVEIDDEVVVGQRFIVFLPEFPSITAAPDGTLYVAWADARAGSRDVLLRRSVDGGDSWSAPVRVHDHPADDETAQYLPRVAATDDGRVAVLYVDQDDTDGAMATTRVAVSADGAAPFETRQLSSRAFDATIGPRPQAAHVEPGVGARLGLAAWDGSLIAVWTDTRIGEDRPELVRQDIAATRVRLPDPPAEADITAAPWSLVLIAAAAVALLALVLVVRRRRAGRR